MQATLQSSSVITDPMISVTVIEGSGTGKKSEWAISQNLTDRWGDINETSRDKKPLADLESNPDLLERLREQMYGEDTFIVRKDGQYGILFELEFMCQESDGEHSGAGDTLPSYDQSVAAIIRRANPLVEKCPKVAFAIPTKEEVFNHRSAIWAFFPNNALDEIEQRTLIDGLLHL